MTRVSDPIAEARRLWADHGWHQAADGMAAVTSLMRAHQIVLARVEAVLKPYAITFARYEVLMLLHFSRRGALPLGKIGERLQVHRTSVTNTIDGLERLGLVRRVPHESDRRAVLAEILPHGHEVAETATRVLNEGEFGTPPLSTADLEAVFVTLRKLRTGAGDFHD